MQDDSNTGSSTDVGERPKDAGTEREREYFSVHLALSGSARTYDDPGKAGAAFFAADAAERPSVVHVDGNAARIMARTEIHGRDEADEPRYAKTLPDSHAPDAAVRAGFHEAMAASIGERLGQAEREAGGNAIEIRIDARLKDDLEAFAKREPDKAAGLWSAHSGDVPPGPHLQSAVASAEAEGERDARAVFEASAAGRPNIVATAPWVTTDRDVELRGVAVATGKGIHTGYEAVLPRGGESIVTRSEMTFPSAGAALRHALDFYEGDEKGLEAAVKQRAAIERQIADEDGQSRKDGSLDRRELPDDDPRPAADGRFEPGRDGPSTPISRAEFRAGVEHWMARVGDKMRELKPETQAELRPEFNALAARALDMLGDRRRAELAQEEPRSTLYRSALGAETPVIDGERAEVSAAQREHLREGLGREATAAGLNGAAVTRRLESGASSALEEREWVKADVAGVAATKGLDLTREADRSAAAGIVDRFYERAGEMLNEARGLRVESAADELRGTLGAMVRMEERQGQVRFESDADARNFVDDMKARYGETIIEDLARGKTDALARDFGDAEARTKIAVAVTSAARDHEPFGLSPREAEAAHERLMRRETVEIERGRDDDRER